MKKLFHLIVVCLITGVFCCVAAASAAETGAETAETAAVPDGYYPSPLQWNDDLRNVATDVSFLNTRPAGANGRIVVRGEEFVESGTGRPVRFIGIGMGGRAALELSHENARRLAARLAKNGVNVVRFHNIDGDNPRDSILDTERPDTRALNLRALDAFDYLFHCLKEEGIYVIMPLKVNRKLKPGDGVPEGTGHKFVGRFDARWIELQKEFAQNVLLHVNPYTGLTPAEDPAVLGIELNNEDCMLRPWVDTGARIRELTAFHRAELEELWREFRGATGAPVKAFDEATPAEQADFLAEMDARYSRIMREFLRDELKVKPLIVDTQMDWGGLAGVRREEFSDYIDSHGYWNHPEFRGTPWKFTRGNWYVRNESQLKYLAGPDQCKLTELASWRFAGRPFSISEYDYPYPCDYTVEMMPLLALVASRQNWNALHLFIHGMAEHYDTSRITGMFDQTNHPGKIGFFPAAALIYRTGMFEPAAEREELILPRKPHTLFANRFDRAWEKTPGGKWRDLLNVRPMIAQKSLPVESETVEVEKKRVGEQTTQISIQADTHEDEDAVFLRASSPRGMVLIGHFGLRPMEIDGFRIAAEPFPGNFGAAVLVSRTEDPVAQSASNLLTVAGRFDNQGISFNRRRNSTQVSAGSIPGLIDCQLGTGPVIATRLDAELSLPADGPRKVYRLTTEGARKGEVPSSWNDGTLSFRIAPDHEAMYYEIVK